VPVLLALDIGEKRTGVAVGSTEGRLARPHSVIRMGGREAFTRRLRELIAQTGAELVVVGCPLQMDGSASPQGERIRHFVAGFGDEVNVPIVFWDEAYSSADARVALIDSGASRKRRREREDAAAAAVFLQRYLDAVGVQSHDNRAPHSLEGG